MSKSVLFKVQILIYSLVVGFFASTLKAAPVLNENIADSRVITIYPDHKDPNLYYIAPNVVLIAQDDSGEPYFSYYEYKKDAFTKLGLMQMTLVPSYTRAELDEATAKIKEKNAKAQFSGLPFLSSRLMLTTELKDLFEINNCSHMAGLIAQEQSCQLVLTRRGRKLFYRSLEARSLFTTLHFEYVAVGMIRQADDGFQNGSIEHGIAARIDGDQLAEYPHLINRKGTR